MRILLSGFVVRTLPVLSTVWNSPIQNSTGVFYADEVFTGFMMTSIAHGGLQSPGF